ncbi:MAG TPA: hypothetical protein VKU94_05360 [Geobacterales bacterium]|nr:hypothetical protein [Geobacterales bacterium]
MLSGDLLVSKLLKLVFSMKKKIISISAKSTVEDKFINSLKGTNPSVI